MSLEVICLELFTIVLCSIALFLLIGFYHKMKLVLVTTMFGAVIVIWIVKSFSRILSDSGIIGIPDVRLWSVVGAVQAILLIVVFWYYINISEKYL